MIVISLFYTFLGFAFGSLFNHIGGSDSIYTVILFTLSFGYIPIKWDVSLNEKSNTKFSEFVLSGIVTVLALLPLFPEITKEEYPLFSMFQGVLLLLDAFVIFFLSLATLKEADSDIESLS